MRRNWQDSGKLWPKSFFGILAENCFQKKVKYFICHFGPAPPIFFLNFLVKNTQKMFSAKKKKNQWKFGSLKYFFLGPLPPLAHRDFRTLGNRVKPLYYNRFLLLKNIELYYDITYISFGDNVSQKEMFVELEIFNQYVLMCMKLTLRVQRRK